MTHLMIQITQDVFSDLCIGPFRLATLRLILSTEKKIQIVHKSQKTHPAPCIHCTYYAVTVRKCAIRDQNMLPNE